MPCPHGKRLAVAASLPRCNPLARAVEGYPSGLASTRLPRMVPSKPNSAQPVSIRNIRRIVAMLALALVLGAVAIVYGIGFGRHSHNLTLAIVIAVADLVFGTVLLRTYYRAALRAAARRMQ